MPKPPPGKTREITRRQLHMLARVVLLADTTITTGEWKEQIYDRLLTCGFGYPRPDHLAIVMSGVERQLEKTFGPRQVAPLAPALVRAKASVPQPWRVMPSPVSCGWTPLDALVATGMKALRTAAERTR